MSERVVFVASFADPAHEAEKLRTFHDAVAGARQETGEAPVPFHRFAELVREQVLALRAPGQGEVAFRLAIRDGRVRLTARALRGAVAGDD